MIAYYIGTAPGIEVILDKARVTRILKIGDNFAMPILLMATMRTLTTAQREYLHSIFISGGQIWVHHHSEDHNSLR